MRRLKVIFSFVFIIILITASSCKSEVALIKNSNNLEYNSPKKVFKLYWNSSYMGDVETVKRISTTLPDDMFGCEGNKVKESKDNLVPVMKEDVNYNMVKEPNGIFLTKDIPEDIGLTSMTIFESKIPFERVKINKERLYKTEAVFDISILNEEGEIGDKITDEQVAFFKKTKEGWKFIGLSLKSGLFSSIDKINYARFRPTCTEID